MPQKRKRGSLDPGGSRPSPHRPEQAALAQHDRSFSDGGGRGGRGGRNTRRSDRRDSTQGSHARSPTSASQPIAPPPARPPPPSASSQAAPVQAMAASSQAAPPSAPPSPLPSHYVYTIITDARVDTWDQGGRQYLVEHGIQSRIDEDEPELSTIYQELLRSVLDSRLQATDAGLVVKEIIGEAETDVPDAAVSFEPRVVFLDTVSIFLEIEDATNQPQLRDVMVATNISPALMRQILDHEMLMRLGFLRETFHRMTIRQSTNLLYRQQSYNLLREESEGFSKLVTELYSSATTAGPEFTFETAQATFERVKGLIGTFDLDVGRVLDVTLDVFAATVIKQFKFFVKLLRISSWWPRSKAKQINRTYLEGLPKWAYPEMADRSLAEEDEEALMVEERRRRDVEFWEKARELQIDAYFQLCGRQVADENVLRLAEQAADNNGKRTAEEEWIVTTKTLPPPGSRVAAQVLGFKLRFYSSEVRSSGDILPANLLYLAALLIKIGFISLCDLYPHIWPFDADMEKVHEKRRDELKEKERKNRPGGGANALMMAGALPDDMPSTGMPLRRDAAGNKADASQGGAEAAAGSSASELPEPLDQKVQLLEHLLTIGALPECLYILGRFPWLPDMYPDTILPLIHRILLQSISKVAKDCQPAPSLPFECVPKKMADPDQSGVPKGSVKQSELQLKRPLRWPFPDKCDVNEGTNYRFYFDEWVDNVPICQNVDDIFTLCGTLLNVSGVNIGREPELLMSLARIGAKSLGEDSSQHNRDRWRDLLKRLLVPALSLTPTNSSCVDAIWVLLEQYPIPVRYNIYAEWYEGSISRLPPMTAAFARTRLETLSTMKRLSLTNISAMARTLAKTAYASPGVVFRVALDQIEAYSNLIQVFVECAKYFTPLGYDVLVWSLMSSLGGKQRSRTQETSVLLTSKWLQALSKFSGYVFKRYAIMDPSPVLQYVNNQLFKGNSTDLVILKELILSMGGLVSDLDFTDEQIQAMTGGPALKRQTLINLQDRRFESTRSGKRLMQALINANLAGRLLINIAQYRQSAIYQPSEDGAHIKYLATVVDDAHQVLNQYLDLLRSNLDPEQFDSHVPDITRLMKDFGLDVSLAFMIGRVGLAFQMSNPKSAGAASQADDSATATQGSQAIVVDAEGDVAMNGDKTVNSAITAAEDKMAVDEKDAVDADNNGSAVTSGRKNDPMLDVLQPLIASVQTTAPEDVWRTISPEFFVIFWSLQLGDMAVPQPRYLAEHDRLKKQAEDVMRDRSDMTRAGMNKKNEKRDALLDVAKTIREEMLTHAERNQKTKLRLLKHASTWFPVADLDGNTTSDTILEQCLLPRLLLSAADTEYCFKMIKFLHENRAPNFKLQSLYGRFFNPNRLRDLIFTCTVREAEHFGRFLKCILGDLTKWHEDKATYEKEGLGLNTKDGRKTYLGFAGGIGDDGKPHSFVEHPQFRDLLYGWHKNLNKALKDCLENSEWMHIRNAITILKTILEFFPKVDFMGRQFSDQLKKITEREAASKTASESEAGHRVDLSVAAQTAFSELQKQKSKWVMVQAFRPNAAGKSQEEPKQGGDQAAPALRPTAPEFKPQRPADAQPTPEAEEDGELKDNKPQASTNASQPASQGKETPPAKALPTAAKEGLKKDAPATTTTTAPSTKPAAAKPAATAPAAAGPPSTSRSDVPKPSTLPAVPPSHSLPNRPDVPVPGRYTTDRYGQVKNQDRRDPAPPREAQESREPRAPRESRDHRDSRDARDPRDAREFRTPDASRTDRPPRDFSGSDRRPDSTNRDSARHQERDREWPSRSDPPPRWNEHGGDSRPSRDRAPPAGGRSHDSRPAREPAVAATPPPPAPQAGSREPAANNGHDRPGQLAAEDRPNLINPERAALIGDNRAPGSRTPRDEPRDRGSSRNQSPRGADRRNADTASSDKARDDRHGRSHHQDQPHPSARDGHGPPPHGQGRERMSNRDGDRGASSTFQGAPSSRQHDADHARLPHQDPNYGRLNAIPSVADIPSGPRGRGRDNGRTSSLNGTMPRSDGRLPPAEPPHRAPSPERHPPTGPASSRSTRRGRGNQFDSSTTSPTTPVGPSSTTGVHPDRMAQIKPTSGAPAQPSQQAFNGPPAPGSTPIHPDRLGQIAGRPPPASTSSAASSSPRPNLPQLHTSDRQSVPSGPSAPQANLPSTPGSQPTPTGPSSAKERTRGRGERMMRGIQDTITGSGSSRRGGTRGRIDGSDAQVLVGGSPVTTPVHERPDPIRRDGGGSGGGGGGGGDRPSANAEPLGPARDSRGTNGDDYQGTGTREHERSGRREHRSSRSERPSRINSRERSPDRDRESKGHRDYRDRRSDALAPPGGTGRDADRDRPPPRRSGREANSANMEPIGGAPSNREANREPLGSGRESRHRGGEGRSEGRGDNRGGEGRGDGGGGGRGAEEWGGGSGRGSRGGGGGGGGPREGGQRPNEDQRDRREERGRKRRSEEGVGSMGSEREKRQRR